MREENITQKTFLKLTLCAIIAVISLAMPALAQVDSRGPVNKLSSVGIARGQVVRLNAYYHNLLPPGPCRPGAVCTAPAAFNAILTFYFADGSVALQKGVTLSPDKGATLVFTPTSFGRDGRIAVRAEVTVIPDPSGYQPHLIPSVEILDATTGQTGILNPGSLVGFNPQPEPPGDFHFGLFNVLKGQTARVNVSFVDTPRGFPPGPCRLVISFYDGDGRSLGQSEQSLDPGKTAEFDYSTANLPEGARTHLRASVHVEAADGSAIPILMPSLEIFAADTGRSTLFIPGKIMGGE